MVFRALALLAMALAAAPLLFEPDAAFYWLGLAVTSAFALATFWNTRDLP